MHAWPAPHVPELPGRGAPLRIFDTAAGAVRETAPESVARLYVCGITPYDATHLGHAATYLAFDLVNRAWRDAGHTVQFVQNVTDVDDPLLERATATGVDWRDLGARETALFREDMTALGVLPPDHYIGVTEAIPLVADAISRLMTSGAAYLVDDDVYFDVSADSHFGEVAHLNRDSMISLSGLRGGDPERPGKRDALDPLLWRAAREGEPSWESSVGAGRPGWHIECSAIALTYLGAGFDVQGGGSDLIFPHHEMSASHAHALGSSPFARHYVHSGMVGYDGEKMSKSRGNLVLVSALRRGGVDPAAIRIALLAHHYRSDWEWTAADLDRAEERLALWRRALGGNGGPPAEATMAAVRAALADDLDAPRALRAVDDWSRNSVDTGAGGAGGEPGAPGLVARSLDALLGIRL